MARCNRGFAAEAEAFCIFRIAHYALIVVNVGERSVINIDPAARAAQTSRVRGIVYLVALLCALAAQIRTSDPRRRGIMPQRVDRPKQY